MKKKLAFAILLILLCAAAAVPALAADVFGYSAESVQVYDGETVTPTLLRDGRWAEGEVVYTARGGACTVDENGAITGVTPGQVYVQADLVQDGKTVRYTSILVRVVRKATKITLLTQGLQVYEPDDETILPLLKQGPDVPPVTTKILVLPAGKGVWPRAELTPDDVRDKRFVTTTSDAGVAKMTPDGQLVAVQPGECELTVTSAQSPEISDTIHVLVTQPVKRVDIETDVRYVRAGKTLQLGTKIVPENATIQNVVWASRNPAVATVDENGLVTGVARGDVVIEAKTTDGTNLTATLYMTVTQDVTQITIQEADVNVATGRNAPQLHVTVLPTNANDRRVTWTSSDESIATVNAYGTITGRKRGECTVTGTSVSNPEVTVTIPVHVIQMVTDITFITPKGLSFHIGETRALEWQVVPADASIQDVTFTSRNPRVAAVDQNGIVTGVDKGQADIEVKATDGSGRYRVYRVTILKAVEGINPMAPQYYAQLNGSTNIKATVYPSDASNQRILWSVSDENIASISSAGTSYGRIWGRWPGYVTVTATTEDGGFSTSTNVIVADFNGMVMCASAYIDESNKIRLVLYNMSPSFAVRRVYFRVDVYDTQGQPMVCSTDGNTYFNGNYPLTLEPLAHTEHGRFNFTNYQVQGMIGYVTITVTGYEFDNGQKWWIPEDKQFPYRSTDSIHMGEPILKETPEDTNG